jgi:hypothetical protein
MMNCTKLTNAVVAGPALDWHELQSRIKNRVDSEVIEVTSPFMLRFGAKWSKNSNVFVFFEFL